jgi:hypothetical protein
MCGNIAGRERIRPIRWVGLYWRSVQKELFASCSIADQENKHSPVCGKSFILGHRARMVRAECGVVGLDPPPFRLTTTSPLTNTVSTIGRLTFAAGILTGR